MTFILVVLGMLIAAGLLLVVVVLYISWLILCGLVLGAAALGGGIGWLLTHSQDGVLVGALAGPVVLALLAAAIERQNNKSLKG